MTPATRMRPVALRHGIGWLHSPAEPRGHGVVLCPALGREARWSYRAVRQLADRLAEQGRPTLRFDYPGTGDAPDLGSGQDPLTAWRESVHHAIDWIRAHTGLEQAALCGLRFGALLAADIAADRADIAAMALLSPILSGRHCARELRLASFGADENDRPETGIEVEGMMLPEAMLAALSGLNVAACAKLPASRILIFDESDRAEALAARLSALGGEVARKPFHGYPAMMRPGTSSQVPRDDLAAIAAWFAAPGACRASIVPRLASPPCLARPGWHEHPVQFGAGRRLVGTLCEPRGSRPPTQAVLITNTGSEVRSGIARFGVRLAHRLAEDGIASLRFDFAGLGDSTLPHEADGHPYQTDRSADIDAALELLESSGYRRLGGIGLCTGAYHLLQAAFRGERFDHLALINLVTFRWQSGDIVDVPQRALMPAASIGRQSCWGGAASAVGRVLDQGTQLLLLLGPGDPGIAALEAGFGPNGCDLARHPAARLRFEDGIDHTLSRRAMQDRVASAVTSFLTAQRALANA